jgi:hypothetical protein
MNEMNILFSLENPKENNKAILISVENKLEENLNYKFLVGLEGMWTTLKELREGSVAIWKPEIEGRYSVMVQAKRKASNKSFDYMSKTDYVVGKALGKLISDIDIDKTEIMVGEKTALQIIRLKCLTQELLEGSELVFEVEATHEDNRMVLYKFVKINSNGSIICIQDYSTKKLVSYDEEKMGDYKLLCMAKDMYSLKEYDDRAMIYYSVAPYSEIGIYSFTSDLSSPQLCNIPVTFRGMASGGRELLYKFIINGDFPEDSGYNRKNNYTWIPRERGEYKALLWVKDASFKGEYEKQASLDFVIDDIGSGNVVIEDIILNKKNTILIGETINVKVRATGGISLRYSFVVFKDDKEIEKIEFGKHGFVDFIPEDSGKFKLEIRVKDKYSKREFDCHAVVYIEALECIPAKIEYVLMSTREYYMVGDTVSLEIITENTKDILINYKLKINGHIVEQTNFVEHKNYELKPKCSGTYLIEIEAKNRASTNNYDSKREVKIEVHDTVPITNTVILCDKTKFMVNEAITFVTENYGGSSVVYEFYLMEKGDWNLVQKFSRKNDYTFMPFTKGIYRMLVLAKSFNKSISYEDYDILEIEVNE